MTERAKSKSSLEDLAPRVRRAHVNVVCKALARRHADSWSVAAVIASYLYEAPRGHQAKRTDGRITAAEFERQIAEALASDPTYKGVPPMSDTTATRFFKAWQLAAKEHVVPDAKTLEVGQVPPTRHITADFDEYLNVVRAGQTKTKPYTPPTVDEELNTWVARFERTVERFEQDLTIIALNDETTGMEMPDNAEWTARMGDVLAAMRSIARFYNVKVDDIAPGPESRLDTWASRMFDALPQPLHSPSYKALSRVLHPDAGGDENAMKTLNDANDRRAK